jgi:rSAM/selenodomain-associated transferase 2
MLQLSVIIPVLYEQERINKLITHLRFLDQAVEIIVADGDPDGSTIKCIEDEKVISLTSSKGRGNQLAAAAAIVTRDVVLMLHADTLLPDNAFQSIRAALIQGATWGAFRLGIDAPSLPYRIIERTVDLRCKLFTLPYGDQAIFVTNSALQKIGGIPTLPLMEDVELARRLRQAGYAFTLLPQRVSTSARRWQKDGTLRRTLKNWWLLLRYLTGISTPDTLLKSYPTE